MKINSFDLTIAFFTNSQNCINKKDDFFYMRKFIIYLLFYEILQRFQMIKNTIQFMKLAFNLDFFCIFSFLYKILLDQLLWEKNINMAILFRFTSTLHKPIWPANNNAHTTTYKINIQKKSTFLNCKTSC